MTPTPTLLEQIAAQQQHLTQLASLFANAPTTAHWGTITGASLTDDYLGLFYRPMDSGQLASAKALAKAVGGDWTMDDSGSWWGKVGKLTLVLHSVEPKTAATRQPVDLS